MVTLDSIAAKVWITDGGDRVFLKTKLPCPFSKEFLPSQPPLEVSFETTYNMGIEYVRKNFNVEPKIINVRTTTIDAQYT